MKKQIDSMSDPAINDELAKVERRVDRDKSRFIGVEEKLGKIGVSLALREALIFDTSDTLVQSDITDSYTSPPAERSGVKSTVPERLIGKAAIKALSERKSISSSAPNSEAIKEGGQNRPDNSDLGFLQRRRDIKHARRLEKQKLRQAKSDEMERIFGGGIGLGQISKHRTKLRKHMLKTEAQQKYKKGELSAKQLLEEKRKIDSQENVIIDTKAVRRTHRRERRGAVYYHARASQPAISISNKIRTRLLKWKGNRVASRINDSNIERQRLLEELEKRK